MRLAWFFVTCAILNAQAELDPADVLQRARDALLERTESLPNYTCVQTVNRYYYRPADSMERVRSCDQLLGDRKQNRHKLELEATDRLRLDVKVSGGHEIGSWVGAKFESNNILELIGGGPFGTGPLGTQIGDIFANDGTAFQYLGEIRQGETVLLEYNYQVPRETSHYKVKAGRDWIVTSFDGSFRIDANTLELKHLMVRSGELATETQACQAITTVDYQRMKVGSGDFLVPLESSLRFVMRDGSETENRTKYSNCHQYHGEATIHFEDVAADDGAKPSEVVKPVAVPVGYSIVLELAQAIDTDTAAAGDEVTMRLRKPVLESRSKTVLIPAGAIVHGRIKRMQHRIQQRASRFEIAVMLETMELNHEVVPFSAVPDRREEFAAEKQKKALGSRGVSINLPPPGTQPGTMSWLFFTEKSRYVVQRGYQSTWLTVRAPETTKAP